MIILLFILTFGPSLIWLYWLWSSDKFQREPIGLIARLAAVGGSVAVAATLLAVPLYERYVPAAQQAVLPHMLLTAALPEELFKLLPVLLLAWRSKEWREPFDGIVYAGAVALGFHLIETGIYMFGAYDSGISNSIYQGLVRGAKPGHMLYGVAMGYFLSRAKFATGWWKRLRSFGMALLVPVGLHTAWNTSSFLGGNFVGGATLQDLMFSMIAWGLSVALWVTAYQYIKENEDASPYNPEASVPMASTGCPQCGARYPRTALYCQNCGSEVDLPAAQG